MKASLLIHPTENRYFNIGDYVQALAAAQYFDCEKFDFIDRESLNTYTGESTKVIMNGWFMFTKNWPPSDQIYPLFVAFHINSTAHDVLLSPESIEYFKKHEPIGCRDEKTCELLKSHGVEAYFSGCLTLTLGKSYQNSGEGYDVYIVDPLIRPKKDFASLCSYALSMVKDFTKIIKIYKKAENHTFMSLLKCAVFYNQYSKLFSDDLLLNAHYPSVYVNNDFESEEEKFAYAKKCLEKYANAKLVITSKIHCQMPCLAMNTPSIFLKDEKDLESSTCRFGGLSELYNIINYNFGEFSSSDLVLNKKIQNDTIIRNKGLHFDIAKKLADTCMRFTKS